MSSPLNELLPDIQFMIEKWCRKFNWIVTPCTTLAIVFALLYAHYYWISSQHAITDPAFMTALKQWSNGFIVWQLILSTVLYFIPCLLPLLIFHKRLRNIFAWLFLWGMTGLQLFIGYNIAIAGTSPITNSGFSFFWMIGSYALACVIMVIIGLGVFFRRNRFASN